MSGGRCWASRGERGAYATMRSLGSIPDGSCTEGWLRNARSSSCIRGWVRNVLLNQAACLCVNRSQARCAWNVHLLKNAPNSNSPCFSLLVHPADRVKVSDLVGVAEGDSPLGAGGVPAVLKVGAQPLIPPQWGKTIDSPHNDRCDKIWVNFYTFGGAQHGDICIRSLHSGAPTCVRD